MKSLETNTVVIGGGPGGYAAAIRLGQLGVDTVLVEKEKVGGTCLNVGCIPSKALIHAAASYSFLTKGTASQIGIQFNEPPTLNWSKTIEWKDGFVGQVVKGVEGLVKGSKVITVPGLGKITGPNTVVVEGDEPTEIHCKNMILAMGSSVIELPPFPFDHENIVDSTDLLALKEIPESMVILGGGIIGMELGFVFSSIGCKVTVIEMLPKILPMYEKDAVKIVEREFKKIGGTIIANAKATEYKLVDGGVELSYEEKGTTKTIVASKLAVTVGRKPVTAGLGLEEVGVKMERGKILINAQLQSSLPNIYAIGDIVDGPMLAHKATAEGVLAAEAIAGEKVSRDDIVVIPDVVYTKPEIASVGLSEEAAKEQGIEVKIGKFPFAALGRAKTTQEPLGYIKYIADAKDDRVIGCVVVGNKASDLISEAALAIEMSATLDDIALTVHPHPSFGEAHMEAAAHALKKAIHIFN